MKVGKTEVYFIEPTYGSWFINKELTPENIRQLHLPVSEKFLFIVASHFSIHYVRLGSVPQVKRTIFTQANAFIYLLTLH